MKYNQFCYLSAVLLFLASIGESVHDAAIPKEAIALALCSAAVACVGAAIEPVDYFEIVWKRPDRARLISTYAGFLAASLIGAVGAVLLGDEAIAAELGMATNRWNIVIAIALFFVSRMTTKQTAWETATQESPPALF